MPLVIGQFLEAVDEKRGIVGSTTGESSASNRSTASVGQVEARIPAPRWSKIADFQAKTTS